MSNVIQSLNPAPSRKQRRAEKAKARNAEAAPVLTLLQGRAVTPRREPELADQTGDADEEPVVDSRPTRTFAEAFPTAAAILSQATITVDDTIVADDRAVDEFYEEPAPVAQEQVDDTEESTYVPPISAPAQVAEAPVVEEPVIEATDAAPAAAPVEATVEPSQPVIVAETAAAEPTQAAKPGFAARIAAAFRRAADATVALVKWVDWVAVAMIAAIPALILTASAYGAVSTAVGIVVVLLVATVVRSIGTEVFMYWLFKSRDKYLRILFEASLVLGIGALLLVAQGGVWQALVGSLVFFLFATRRKASA